jgi:two-component system OmpR family response regulator
MLRVLVVDDESAIRDLVATALRYEGFETFAASSGLEAIHAVNSHRPHLVLLDVQMPDLDGFSVQARMQAAGVKVPVIFLTARDGTADKVRGLTVGADDYITKPFSLDELIARVRAVLRRTGLAQEQVRIHRFGHLELDEDSHLVTCSGTEVDLTPTEFKLLRYFMLNQGRVLSKSQILDHVWQYDFDGDGNVVEIYVSYLRRKLDPLGPPLLHTVRGVGYCMRLQRT